jgi:hypothetical protein
VAKFWACPVVPLSRDKEEISVPLSRKVALSRPVGNPSLCTHAAPFLTHSLSYPKKNENIKIVGAILI